MIAVERAERGARLRIASRLSAELAEGDSIAVNGVCLTATAVEPASFAADAVNETLARSTLGDLAVGSPVNLEPPLRADQPLGGHIVQGHVDGTATVRSVGEDGFGRVVWLDPPPALARYLVEKGSVALDGVSLTVSALDDAGFAVALIPETLARTTLGRAQAGDRVNLEVDILAKHVERLLQSRMEPS